MVSLVSESWTWYAVVMLVWISRVISRRMTLGSFRKFQADDYLMAVVLCFYLTLIVTINIVSHARSNLLPPNYGKHHNFSHQEIEERTFGSKLILVVEQCQCVTVWGVKICLIILYLRITTVYRENLAVKILLGYVILTFVVMDILYFGVWCQPFQNYWAVPVHNTQCDAATNHLITNAVFNLTSDVSMLLIGLPMFLRMKLPWKKKIPLIGIFSLGIFTILAAVLNKVYSFTEPFGAQWTYWYTRESSTALLVANLPFCWTFWRRITGSRSIKGQSIHDSLSPQDALSRRGTGDGKPVGGSLSSPADSNKALEHYEMRDAVPRRPNMSFAEMLNDGEPTSIDDGEPNPITHPMAYFSKNRSASVSKQQALSEKAALEDDLEFQTVQSETSPGGIADRTPASSVYPLQSKESAHSFV